MGFTIDTLFFLAELSLKALLVVIPLFLSMAFLLYFDRKIWAAVQLRRGPNVVGAFGLLQSFADFFKLVLKEIVIPAGSDRVIFILAPLITFVLGVVAWAVIPFNYGWVLADINAAPFFGLLTRPSFCLVPSRKIPITLFDSNF